MTICSKHAQAYRQLSLLLSGRRAEKLIGRYLLSAFQAVGRSAKLMMLGRGSITAIPIVETQAGHI